MLKNQFVVFGADRKPELHLLDAEQVKRYYDWPAHKREKANIVTFGYGAENVIPCTLESMVIIAEGYVGMWEKELRGLCAVVAIGRPFGPLEFGEGSDGNSKIDPVKPKPRKPAPSGKVAAAVSVPATVGA